MKAKILLLAIALMITGLTYSQDTVKEKTTNCDKHVLNKIHKNMKHLKLNKYLEADQKVRYIVTCRIGDDNLVEIVRIHGLNEELKKAIITTLKDNPVECKSKVDDSQFTFLMRFEMKPSYL